MAIRNLRGPSSDCSADFSVGGLIQFDPCLASELYQALELHETAELTAETLKCSATGSEL